MSDEEKDWRYRLVQYLYRLAELSPNVPRARAELAKIRRGVGKAFNADVFQVVAQHNVPPRHEDQASLIVSLFGFYPEPLKTDDSTEGEEKVIAESRYRRTLGTSLRELKDANSDSDGPERRLRSLLQSDREDLGAKLRQVVSLLRSHEITIDWQQLLNDLIRWDDVKRSVQKRWSQDFWAPHAES